MIMNYPALAADAYSEIIYPGEHEGFSLTYSWTGTLLGPLYLQARNDPLETFMTLSEIVISAAPNGSAGQGSLVLSDTYHKEYRMFFDFTSGAGNLEMRVNY